MDDIHGTERTSVYHAHETDAIVAELWPAGPPRLFALIQEDEDEDEVVRQVAAYGIELPDGEAATFGTVRGRWCSADSASYRTDSNVLWLSH